MKERNFVARDHRIDVYYPGSDILMYSIRMEPINGDCKYGPFQRAMINLMRRYSGLSAAVNSGTLRGVMGPAEMIDYIDANEPHGPLDRIFMGGSVNAVRSRIKKVEETMKGLVRRAAEDGREFKLYEAGSGFLRIPLEILDAGKEGIGPNLAYIGIEKDAKTAEVAKQIAEFEDVAGRAEVRIGDALEELEKEGEFDGILVEGAMEYWGPEYRSDFARESYRHLREGGMLVSTATHMIPKERFARILDLYFTPMSENDFVRMFRDSGFGEIELIKTEPPNISIGIGKK